MEPRNARSALAARAPSERLPPLDLLLDGELPPSVEKPPVKLRAPIRVLIAICTRQRPKLLDTCLASVCAQQQTESAAFEIAIIENNDRLTCTEMAERHSKASGIPIHTVLEPELGIP